MWVHIIDTLFGIGLFINALLFVPQGVRIVRQGNSADISLVTFLGFCVTQLLAVIYGYIHHDWVLTIGYIFALSTCGVVTGLAIFYRIKLS